MPIGDYVRSLFSRIANGPYDKDKKDKPTTPNLANGGHTGYHPLPPKKARQKDYSADQQNMNQYTVQGADQPMYDTAQQNVWQDASALGTGLAADRSHPVSGSVGTGLAAAVLAGRSFPAGHHVYPAVLCSE